ncbi:hypothetical protein BGZ99_001618 [Dissophora globulifera]|uniref:Uncharacterized protein n=1 Tax=Dissophora globulifera TaxID=979702 RepID=A0A9P6RSR7_9FUNG|nr:hypothetical protein BGZ99_001618 [Dissophora globulifera]
MTAGNTVAIASQPIPASSPSVSASASASTSPSGTSTPTSSASSAHHETCHSNDAGSPLTQILTLYHKSTSTFLLRQLAVAYSTSLEALDLLARTNKAFGLDQATASLATHRSFFVLKQKLWILNITIFGAMLTDRAEGEAADANGVQKRLTGSSKEQPEKLVKDLWRRLLKDYESVEGDIDGQVMVAFVLLCINQKLYTVARQGTESYLATIPDGMLIHLETAAGALQSVDRVAKDPLMTNYERLVELYAVHVLAKLKEWDYARQFLEFNTVLSESSKVMYNRILNKLEQKSQRPKKIKRPLDTGLDPLLTTASSTSPPSSSSTPAKLSSTVASDAKNIAASALATSPKVVIYQPTIRDGSSSVRAASESHAAAATLTKTGASLAGTGTGNGASANTALVTTLQGRVWILLQHYVDQIRHLSTQLGPSQMMAVVGIVVFVGAVSRNRTRASRVVRMVVDKVMQTIKMGTAVTSI